MKILIIQPTADKRGHYGIYTTHVCQELARLGHQVVLFTNKIYPEMFIKEKILFEIIEWRGGKYKFDLFDETKTKRPFFYSWGYLRNSFVILKAALKFAQINKFDIVQIFDTEYGIISVILKLYRINFPIILMVNAPNFSYSEFTGPFLIKIYKGFQKRLLSSLLGTKIKGVNMLGEFHEREFRKQFKLPQTFPIEVIYDGADPPEIHLSKEEARKKIGIKYMGTVFLFFGMVRKDKGLRYFLEAVSLLPNEDFKIIIAGSLFDYQESDIVKMIDNFGIKDRVITRFDYIGIKEVYNYFFASNVLVLPYVKLYRGGSGPLLKEAAICKVPVIVSDVAEMGPLVRKYNMGLVSKPESISSLVATMEDFLHLSKDKRSEMGENAFKIANTWSKIAKKYEEFYKRF